jgi:hypothetical protein
LEPQRVFHRWNETSDLNGSERRTVVSPQRFSKQNMLHFLCGAVAAERLAVAMEYEKTYLLARTRGKTTARPPVFVCRSKQVHT